MNQDCKPIVITMMPGKESELTMYVCFDWDVDKCPVWLELFLEEDYPAFVFLPSNEEEEYSFRTDSNAMEFQLTHPMYVAPALYERLGWTKYMSYRMKAEPSENGEYIFDLKNAAPYAVDDYIEPEEMERLRKELTPMELTKLFLPGATEPYPL